MLKISCLEGRGRPDWIKVHKFEIIKAAAAGDKTNFIHPLLVILASNCEAATSQSRALQMQILNWQQQDATGGKEARTILPPILRAKNLNYPQINIFQKYKVGRFLIILITDFGLMKSTPYIMNVLYTTVWSFLYGSAELHFCFIVINTEIQTTDREDIRKGISEPKHVYPHLYS